MRWATQLLCLLMVFAATGVRAADSPSPIKLDEAKLAPFFKQHCVRCHSQDKPKGDTRLDNAAFTIATVEQAQWWQDVLDTLNGGVMPPKKEPQPPNKELTSTIAELTDKLTIARRQWESKGGRAVLRRLSPREYAATIQHLFGFEPDLKDIPDDPNVKPFDTVGSEQVFSSTHIERYFELGQKVVAVGFRLAPVHEPSQSVKSEPEVRKNQLIRKLLDELGTDPTKYRGKPYVLVKHALAYRQLPKAGEGVYLDDGVGVNRAEFNGPGADPRATYRVRIVAGLHGEVSPFRRFVTVEPWGLIVTVSGTVDRPEEHSAMIHPTLGAKKLSGFIYDDRRGNLSVHLKHLEQQGDLKPGGAKKEGWIWIDRMVVEGPFYPTQRSFFDELVCPQAPKPGTKGHIVWNKDNARQLIEAFAFEAFRRRKPSTAYVDGLENLFHKRQGEGKSFEEAMSETLGLVLASPSFLYLNEAPAKEGEKHVLSAREKAIRLSYFLWSSPPDAQLYKSAEAGDLDVTEKLKAVVERMLKDPKAANFAKGFGSQWGEFDRFDALAFEPDQFPTFSAALRKLVKQETIRFFQHLVDGNLPVSNLIRSEVVTINARLAQHYGIAGVTSDEFLPVKVPKESHRGGYLTQAAFLAAGSNGMRTSPSIRGAILMDRLLHSSPPPPPPNVPELGAAGGTDKLTTRQLVELHQRQPQCASCHNRIDSLGLELENFDAIGRWRTVEKVGQESKPLKVSGALPDGKQYADFEELRTILESRSDKLAHGMVESVLAYGLGRRIGFSDRNAVEDIIKKLRPHDFRMRDLVHAVVQSPLFQTK